MEKIYILKKGKAFIGPFSLIKLKERPLKATDLIWYEGLPDWTAASQVDLVRDVISAEPTTENARKPFKMFITNLFKIQC